MKKFIIAAIVAVSAMTANAQVWIGGNIGFNTTTNTVKVGDVSTDNSAQNFEIAPEVGYNLGDNWAIALKIGYAHTAEKTLGIDNYKVSGRANSFSINPYVRYTFVKAGNFSAFVDGGVALASTHINGTSDYLENPFAISVGINPGIAYAVSNKVTLVAHIGDLSYSNISVKTKSDVPVKVSSSKFNINLINSISFGAYYNF